MVKRMEKRRRRIDSSCIMYCGEVYTDKARDRERAKGAECRTTSISLCCFFILFFFLWFVSFLASFTRVAVAAELHCTRHTIPPAMLRTILIYYKKRRRRSEMMMMMKKRGRIRMVICSLTHEHRKEEDAKKEKKKKKRKKIRRMRVSASADVR